MFLHGESRRDLPPSGVFPGLTEVKEDQAEEEGLATPRRSSREAFDAVSDGVSRHPLKAIFLADRPQGSRPCMPEPPWCERSTGGPRIADARGQVPPRHAVEHGGKRIDLEAEFSFPGKVKIDRGIASEAPFSPWNRSQPRFRLAFACCACSPPTSSWGVNEAPA